MTTAKLSLSIEASEDSRGRYKRKIWGGESSSAMFEWELLQSIACIFLPALRDAEDKLRAYRGSRLARLLRNLNPKRKDGEKHSLEVQFEDFNSKLLEDESIKSANDSIKKYLLESMGPVLSQDATIQFSESTFDRIVERLRLLYYPRMSVSEATRDANRYRDLVENSLGYNNILYLATVLAEFEGLAESETLHKILLIEEPEAHLHPQMQIRLLTFLHEKASKHGIQIIVTSHSPTIAAAVSLDAINVISLANFDGPPECTMLSTCGLSKKATFFLERWMDVTKSTLLFAKGVILVEGIAEALVLPELVKLILREYHSESKEENPPNTLDEYGISIINMNGIYFEYFIQLFKGYRLEQVEGEAEDMVVSIPGIPVKCSGITDRDPKKDTLPTFSKPEPSEHNKKSMALMAELEKYSKFARIFSNLKTFEYDLAFEGENLKYLLGLRLDLEENDGDNRKQLEAYEKVDWAKSSEDAKAAASKWFLDHIGKGEFAQQLAHKLSEDNTGFVVPKYIKDAILWVLPEKKS